MADRERFEEWALANDIGPTDLKRSEQFPDNYHYIDIHAAWLAWQAALAAERKRLKEVLEKERERRLWINHHIEHDGTDALDWAIRQIGEGHE